MQPMYCSQSVPVLINLDQRRVSKHEIKGLTNVLAIKTDSSKAEAPLSALLEIVSGN